jgi:hypothetical protein
MDPLKVGTEVAIKRPRNGRFAFHGYEYTYTTVTRLTKTLIFVASGKAERTFRRDNLKERTSSYRSDLTLLVGAEEIAKTKAEAVEKKERNAVEQRGVRAAVVIEEKFGVWLIENRSEEEIGLLAAVAEAFEAHDRERKGAREPLRVWRRALRRDRNARERTEPLC